MALSVVVLNATQAGWVRFGDNGPGTDTSTVNMPANTAVANSVIVVPDVAGQVSATLGGTGIADVLIDVDGYYTDAATTSSGSHYVPLTPARICDTRRSTGNAAGCTSAIQAGEIITVAGNGGVPIGATAVAVNITAITAPTSGSISAWAAGDPQPNTSNLNLVAGQTTSATSQIKLNIGTGQMTLSASAGPMDLILDVQGYYTQGAGTTFVPVKPARILYTGDPSLSGGDPTPLGSGQTRTLKVTGATDSTGQVVVPALSSSVCAAVLNVSAVFNTTDGFLAVVPHGNNVTTSSVNFRASETRANMTITKLSTDGSVDIYNGSAGPTHLIVDLIGYFSPDSGSCP